MGVLRTLDLHCCLPAFAERRGSFRHLIVK